MGGFLGPLATILGFGAPIAKAGAIGLENVQEAQQQQANTAAFGKALDSLGPNPEFDLMRQMFKSGASPEAIGSVMGGPIGRQLQQQYQQQQWKDFVGPGGMESLTPEKVWQGYGAGIFSGSDALKFQEDWNKNQVEKMKAQRGGQPKLSADFNTYLATQGLTQEDLQGMDQAGRDKVTAGFDQMYQKGPGATKLQTIHNWDTGNDDIVAVPAHPAAGTVVGQAKPPVGGNPVAMLGAVSTGMNETLNLLKPYGDSNLPMQLPEELRKRGIAPSKEYVELMDQVGIVNTTLTTMIMRAGGFRNVTAAAAFMNTHVPQPGIDSPAQMRFKIDQWMKPGPGGLMNQYRMMLGQNMYVVPTASGGLTTVPMPPPGAGAGGGPPPDVEDVD